MTLVKRIGSPGRIGLGSPKEKVMAKKEKVIGNGWGMGKGKEKAKKEKVMEKTLKGKVKGKEMGKERGRGGKRREITATSLEDAEGKMARWVN